MDQKQLQERIDTLERLSGFRVLHRRSQSGTNYFQFMHGKATLKTVCTYRKARVFAEGVKLGVKFANNKRRV